MVRRFSILVMLS